MMNTLLDFLSRHVEQLVGRTSGPLNFRFLMMPTVVTFLAVRAYRRDVREGEPIYLGAFFTSPSERRRLLHSGLQDFGRIFVVACLLDVVYQILVFRAFYPVEMLIVAVVCAIVPYFVMRGPVTRIVHSLRQRRHGSAGTSAKAVGPAVGHEEKPG